MRRLPARLLLLGLLAGSLGFVGYVARSGRFPMRDVVVPVTGKQYRVHDARGFTAFVVFGPDREAWQREAKGLTPYVARRATAKSDTAAFALAIRPGFAHLFPPTEVGWFRYALREGEWQMVAESKLRPRPTPVP
jgi:hypothetical protein